jgi:Predicted hydrolases or acyltransferases (alpha/beta hydrolase superfamily)
MFRVFTLDLPGFGNSKPLKEPFSIDDISRKVISWIQEKGLRNVVLVGHSDGGVRLPGDCRKGSRNTGRTGIVSFYGYPDSKEKKESRNKAMAFIAKNGATAFTSSFITPLFANPQHPDIEKVRSIAMQSTAETLTGYIRAMRNRPDRQEVLKNFPKKILFLAGEKDAGIPIDTIHRQAGLVPTLPLPSSPIRGT